MTATKLLLRELLMKLLANPLSLQAGKWLVMFALSVLSVTAPAEAADLLETYRAAQGQDSVFAAARATRRAGQEKLPQGRSLL